MKTFCLFILFLVTGFLRSKAQEVDTNNFSSQQIDTSINIIQVPIGSMDSAYLELYDTVRAIRDNYKQNAVSIYHLLQGRELSNLSKYELVKGNLLSSTDTYLRLNRAINGLKSGFSSDSLDLFVDGLNNSRSQELGVSFNERIIKMVDQILLRGKTNKRSRRIMESITFMVNDSLFKENTKLTPPVEIISSIMTLLRTTAVDDDRISSKRLDKLEQELNKYVIYYSALNDGKHQFNYGLSVIQDELTTLQKNIYIQVKFIADALDIPLAEWRTQGDLTKSLDLFFTDFTKPYLQGYLDKLEKKHTIPGTTQINYDRLLRKNGQITEINNQLDDLVLQIKKFDNIDDEYFTLLNSYYAKIINSLNQAADSGLVSKEFIRVKETELSELKTREVSKTNKAVDLKGLNDNTPYIKYRYKVF